MKMKFTLPVLAGAALVTASAVPRDYETGLYTVTNALFNSEQRSKGDGKTTYSFNISDSLRAAHTSCSLSFANNEHLPTFTYTACADPLWSFALEETHNSSSTGNGYYRLRVTHYQVIDGHKTNNETACNTNDLIYAHPNQDPFNAGSTFSLVFANATGGQPSFEAGGNFTMPWVYGLGSVCP